MVMKLILTVGTYMPYGDEVCMVAVVYVTNVYKKCDQQIIFYLTRKEKRYLTPSNMLLHISNHRLGLAHQSFKRYPQTHPYESAIFQSTAPNSNASCAPFCPALSPKTWLYSAFQPI